MNYSRRSITAAFMLTLFASAAVYADASSEPSQVIADGAKVTVE